MTNQEREKALLIIKQAIEKHKDKATFFVLTLPDYIILEGDYDYVHKYVCKKLKELEVAKAVWNSISEILTMNEIQPANHVLYLTNILDSLPNP